jgi:predicted amidohydrolase
VAASGECGARNIGNSMIIDPLGTVRARLSHTRGLTWTDTDHETTLAARRTLPVLANRRFAVSPELLAPGELP